MDQHDDAMKELAALHGMGLLPSDEQPTIEAHLQTCAACREEYAQAAGIAARLALSTASAPPPELRGRVLQAISAPAPRPVAASTKVIRFEKPQARAWWRWSLSGGVIAALVVAIVAALHGFRPVGAPQPGGTTTAKTRIINAWTAACSPKPCASSAQVLALTSGVIQLRAMRLRELPAGKAYQAWVIAPGSKPVPEPTFRPDAQGNGEVAFAAVYRKGMVVAITVEPSGGSKAPTTKPFLVAALN